MSLRDYLHKLDVQKKLLRVGEPISKTFEIAGVLKRMEPSPVLFERVRESAFPVAGNLFCSKAAFADYFGIQVVEIIPFLTAAIQGRMPPEVVTEAPCQEVVELSPDLDRLPILFHCDRDGGNYISSGVVLARHPVHGQNADFHRCMQFSRTEMSVRVVRGRHFDTFLQNLKQVDVAICIGNAPNVLAAAATSVDLGVNELEIANALQPFQVVRAKTSDLLIPAETEFVIEGTIHLDRTHAEGPFVDLTETYDVVRQEPVLEIRAVTHRRDAVWHALLPGALEHKLLMGMPREPTIFREVNRVVRCLDVNVNPGGCSWLHAIVQIDKRAEDDGKRAIEAAFAGHGSCKHVYVVDRDIDIYDPLEVEWAMATRFQGDRDLVVRERAPGSSLDPSADAGTHVTTRLGFDLTAPLETAGKSFRKADFPEVDLKRFTP
ncbi:MAG: UbiD family decarboxylase [Anaerolineales bacterium]|nr:UbiD family decarboxylase [Anaerolineales bacterium]